MDTLREIITPIAQVISAVGIAIGYLLLIKNQREMIRERREEREAGGRPQVVVTADHSHLPKIYVVVRNFTKAPAKDITFDFSAPVESSEGLVLSDLPFFKEGLPFLAPEGTITCYWDSMPSLAPLLKEKGLEDGISVTTRYKDLAEESYETEWKIDPLLYEGAPILPSKGINDLVDAVEKIRDYAEMDGRRQTVTSSGEG